MTDTPKIGFVGFGEAAYHIGDGLRQEGIGEVSAFDVMTDDPARGPAIRERMRTARVKAAANLRELIVGSEIILCATNAKHALGIAEEAANFLQPGQIYADLNSASPKLKQDIAARIEKSGALFVDAAVMESVPPHRHRVPISASGTGAAAFQAKLAPFGMKIALVGGEAGSASALKMMRSIFMKGFSALLLETLVAARKAGIEEEILASLERTLSSAPLVQLVQRILPRTAIHAERRVGEMEEVIATLREMGLDSAMSAATQSKLQSLVDMELKTRFNHQAPDHYGDVLQAVIELSDKR